MDQQQEQREGKGGVRERGEELWKEREQSWWWAGGGSRALGRSDWDDRAAQINSSVVCILPLPLRGLDWRYPPKRVANLQALPLKGECRLPKLKLLPEQRHPGAFCMPRRRFGLVSFSEELLWGQIVKLHKLEASYQQDRGD